MPEEHLSSENVSSLIDHLMKTQDPATVGLRRILKKKEKISRDFPLQSFTLENFSHSKGAGGKVFSENEQRIMEFENKLMKLEEKLAKFMNKD